MSVTAAEGFVAAGVHAGLKASRRDMALLTTDDGKAVPCAAVSPFSMKPAGSVHNP